MSRTLLTLTQEVRELLRAEGIDGGGFSDFIIRKSLNAGLADVSETYPTRSTITFDAQDGVNEYDLDDKTIAPDGVTDIVKVLYDGRLLQGISIDEYLNLHNPASDNVRQWVLWGKLLMLVGAVEEKPIKVYITRPAKELKEPTDVPETPPVADKAIVQYALALCFQEAREVESYTTAMGNYFRMRSSLNLYGSPRGQREVQTRVRDSYWGAVRGRGYSRPSDKKPHNY